jgi:hypothetical protein
MFWGWGLRLGGATVFWLAGAASAFLLGVTYCFFYSLLQVVAERLST